MGKYRLHLEPVWEKTLSEDQKVQFDKLVQTLSLIENEWTSTEVTARKKRDGGFVATILLNNGYDKTLDVEKIVVEILDAGGERIVEGQFEPGLQVNAHSSQPWSFLFSKEMVFQSNPDLHTWQAKVKIDTNKG